MDNHVDILVAGGGLAGLTAANRLAQSGHKVLLVEQHSMIGGLATYFKRKGHIFDVALHGFPVGMKKSLRKYWGKEFAERVIQVKSIRFDNPQFQLDTTFDTTDFTSKLVNAFHLPQDTVNAFFAALEGMNYYDNNPDTIRTLFNRYFPNRTDVWRFLLEPITYANGSGLDEPAIAYGIVFGNFMSQGVYTFLGGTDLMLSMMKEQLIKNGVQLETNARLEKVLISNGKIEGAIVNGKAIKCRAVVFNGNIKRLVSEIAGEDNFSREFLDGFAKVRLSNSSCQVYIGIKPGKKIPYIGDLVFSSEYPEYDTQALLSPHITSRTFSVYYPEIRPGSDQYSIVASMNANYSDWDGLPPDQYQKRKQYLIDNTLDILERKLPNIRKIADYIETSTPCTFQRYTGHAYGATFGTKFEGLDYSMNMQKQVAGLFHTGSVGIIMSGWLGAANYGVITANEVDKYLHLAN
ncbi:MAG: NAD(P)/FAD-dependent oxidoreductase [Victivallales bacterium]|nr:NAD(P)/FAD-dependent oxidoreductase [Victivallales bacterium]